MKRYLQILIFCISLTGCSQEKKDLQQQIKIETKSTMNIEQYIAPESKNITQKNYAEKVFESIKHYDSEPVYYYRINKQNCLIEVYSNDVRNYRSYELSNVITPIGYGHILKSGKQKVTVKMYPVGNLINEDLGLEDQPPSTRLSDKAQVSIEIIMIDEKSKKKFSDETVITKQISTKEASGKEFYEFSFTFEAKVPYEFEGWSKGQDLIKLNPDLVRKKAEEFYQMIGQLYINKDLDSALKLEFPLEKRLMASSFVDQEYLKDLVEEFKDDVTSHDYNIQSIQGSKIEYMGDGKLIRLITPSHNPKLRGAGALLLNYGKGGVYQPGITLYLPEGRDLATQGFMMWK